MARPRLGPRRHFGNHQPALAHRRLPCLVLGRIKDVDPARDHADRARIQRSIVCRAVDSASQPRHHDQVALAKVMGKAAREAARRGRGVARADQRHGLPVEQGEVALGRQQRRRILELRQQARVKALPQRQPPGAELLDPLDLALGMVAAVELRRLAPAAPGEVGNRGQRRSGATEARDQLAIGDRPDAGRPDQPQAVG